MGNSSTVILFQKKKICTKRNERERSENYEFADCIFAFLRFLWMRCSTIVGTVETLGYIAILFCYGLALSRYTAQQRFISSVQFLFLFSFVFIFCFWFLILVFRCALPAPARFKKAYTNINEQLLNIIWMYSILLFPHQYFR